VLDVVNIKPILQVP